MYNTKDMEELKNVKINISVGTVVKILIVLAIAAGLYFMREMVLVLLTAVVIASAVDPAAAIWYFSYYDFTSF